MGKERYINLSDRQVKDTQNQSQDFLSVKTICRLLNKQDQQIADLEAKLAERGKEIAIRNEKLNELKNELHKRDESLQRKKQQVEDVHKAVKQAKKESAKKGREVCIANNEVVQYQKQIRLLNKKHNQEKIELLEMIKNFFCVECEDADGIKTGDWEITKDACEVAEYIDEQIKMLRGEK